MSETEQKTAPRGLTRPGLVLAGLSLVAVCIMAQLYGPIALIPEISAHYSVGPEKAAWVISSFGFALAAGFLVFGRLSDRFGRRVCMVTGLVGAGLSSVGIAFAEGFEMILWLRAAQGFFTAGFPPSTIAWLQERLPVSMRMTGTAVFTCSLLVSGIVGQMLAAVGGFGEPLRWAAMAPALFFMLAAFVVAIWLPGGVAGRIVASGADLQTIPYRRLLRVYIGSALSLVPFVMFFAAVEIESAAGRLMADPVYVRYVGLPGLLATAFAGLIIRRFGVMRMVLLGFVLMGLAFLGPIVADAVTGVYIAGAVFTFGIAVAIPALLLTVGNAAPDARALAISIHASVQFVGVALAPAVTGLMLERGYSLTDVCLLAAGLSFFAVVMNIRPARV